jgi:hypothetical protein
MAASFSLVSSILGGVEVEDKNANTAKQKGFVFLVFPS